MLIFKWIKGTEDLTDVHYLRRVVFIEEQTVPEDRERIDHEDEASLHLLVCEGDKPIATGRIFMKDNKFTLQRIAVLKERRGEGLGKLVTEQLAAKCFEIGAGKVILSSQLHAKGFYEQLGFEAYGEEYMDAGIAHVSMYLNKPQPIGT